MNGSPPALEIEIRGPHRGGKSVLATLLQSILAAEGISATFNEEVDVIIRDNLSKAIANLRKRGLSITINEISSKIEQIDATVGFKR